MLQFSETLTIVSYAMGIFLGSLATLIILRVWNPDLRARRFLSVGYLMIAGMAMFYAIWMTVFLRYHWLAAVLFITIAVLPAAVGLVLSDLSDS